MAPTPALVVALPRVDLGVKETPVERWVLDGVSLLSKRDDLSADELGGNKVRALEFLLAGVQPGRVVLTVGPTGSTHALAVARYAGRLGARADVITWPQETHAVSVITAARLRASACVTHARSPLDAYARAGWRRAITDVCWIPAGASVPLGAVGHVLAALELVAQCARNGLSIPKTIVVPLGSGGTVAGLLVGFTIAGVSTKVVGVRVAPRIVANRRRVMSLARRTHELVTRASGGALPSLDERCLVIDDHSYGGAYGRETPSGKLAAAHLAAAGGPRLDATYSAKALASALELARETGDEDVLFWLTFDGRWIVDGDEGLRQARPT